MGKVAYLGPEFSHSHDVMLRHFVGDEHIPCTNFDGVLDALLAGVCETAVLPLFNNNSKGVDKAFDALVPRLSRLYVHSTLSHPVEHQLCGSGTLQSVRTIHTIGVAKKQVDWIRLQLSAIEFEEALSTSEAIRRIHSAPPDQAAIGSSSAANGYRVPIIAHNIHLIPNETCFFVIRRECPSLADVKHMLISTPQFPTGRDVLARNIVDQSCSITWNWVWKGIRLLEITPEVADVSLAMVFQKMVADNGNVSMVGGSMVSLHKLFRLPARPKEYGYSITEGETWPTNFES